MFVLASIASTVLIVCGLTWTLAQFQDRLPVLVTSLDQASKVSLFATGAVLVASLSAVVLQWRSRHRSVLDLWLLVVTLAWIFGSIMLVSIDVRYDVAWYATPGFSIVSATVVLLVLLSETVTLHAQLAISVLAQRREREGRHLSMEVMSGAIAHEIKQPLSAIVTGADTAVRWLDRTPPEVGEAQDSLKLIAHAARRAASISESVRALYRNVRHGRGVPPRTPVDTNELIRESLSILRGELEAAKITVRLELAKELTLIAVDSGQLQQVLLNLITNAADAMRATTDRARVLKITSRTVDANSVCLSIEDTGTGIDPKDIDRVLEPFFTTKSNGMGLGLAICRSIVESYDGTVTVGPNAPHGSIFRINLPNSQLPD